MKRIFDVDRFHFPYTELKFPGQASDEKILYITREAPIMLYLRLAGVVIISLVLAATGGILINVIPGLYFPQAGLILLSTLLLGAVFLLIGWWWIYQLWKKSVFVLTTRRLTKFIYTTPWNRYNLSLNLDKIVDTGAYARGYFQALFGIGTFAARSSAGNRSEKYFYIDNVHRFEDLKHYVGKVLFQYSKDVDSLENYRPFIPWLKGEARKEYIKKYPHYWS